MKVWWQPNPLNENDSRLLMAALDAHAKSAYRENISTTAVLAATVGNGRYENAIASALLCVGGKHAPLLATYDLLSQSEPDDLARRIVQLGAKVPGWGNSFWKGKPDELWNITEALLRPRPIWRNVEKVQAVMKDKGLFPNPSCYTAAVGIELGIPRESIGWLFVAGRLQSWTQIFNNRMREE